MNKLLSCSLIITLLFSSTISFASSDIKYSEMHYSYNTANQNTVLTNQVYSPLEKKLIFDKLEQQYNDSHKLTDAQINNALKKYKLPEITNATSNQNSRLSSDYDANKAKLREANFIEGVLDSNEGLSSSDILKVGSTHANSARSLAQKEFPSDEMLKDAFRHFTWNHLSTKDIGNIKTRTATINHEWGIILLTPLNNFFDNKFKEYEKQGYRDAGTRALGATIAYIPECKDMTIRVCKENYKFFKSIFSVASIMDLHNNCWGRAYATSQASLTYKDAFYKAKNNGELILSESNVTDFNYDYIWRSQWYTY